VFPPLKKAVSQYFEKESLTLKNGVPSDYIKIAEVKVLNTANDVYNFSEIELIEFLQKGIDNFEGASVALLQFKEVNILRLHTTLGVTDVRVTPSGNVVKI